MKNNLTRDYVNELVLVSSFLTKYNEKDDSWKEAYFLIIDNGELPTYNQRYRQKRFVSDNEILRNDNRYELMLKFNHDILELNELIKTSQLFINKEHNFKIVVKKIDEKYNYIIKKYFS